MEVRLYCTRDDKQLLPISGQADEYNSLTCSHEFCNFIFHLDEIIFTASCMTMLIVLQLPIAIVDGKSVPIYFASGVPPVFRAFLMCLMGACYGSVCSIHIRKSRPKLARIYYAFGVISMIASFLIVLCVTVWEMYKAWFELFTSSPW